MKVWLALNKAVLFLRATAGRSSLLVSICSWALVANTHTSRDERRHWRFLCCCIHRNSSRYVTWYVTEFAPGRTVSGVFSLLYLLLNCVIWASKTLVYDLWIRFKDSCTICELLIIFLIYVRCLCLFLHYVIFLSRYLSVDFVCIFTIKFNSIFFLDCVQDIFSVKSPVWFDFLGFLTLNCRFLEFFVTLNCTLSSIFYFLTLRYEIFDSEIAFPVLMPSWHCYSTFRMIAILTTPAIALKLHWISSSMIDAINYGTHVPMHFCWSSRSLEGTQRMIGWSINSCLWLISGASSEVGILKKN